MLLTANYAWQCRSGSRVTARHEKGDEKSLCVKLRRYGGVVEIVWHSQMSELCAGCGHTRLHGWPHATGGHARRVMWRVRAQSAVGIGGRRRCTTTAPVAPLSQPPLLPPLPPPSPAGAAATAATAADAAAAARRAAAADEAASSFVVVLTATAGVVQMLARTQRCIAASTPRVVVSGVSGPAVQPATRVAALANHSERTVRIANHRRSATAAPRHFLRHLPRAASLPSSGTGAHSVEFGRICPNSPEFAQIRPNPAEFGTAAGAAARFGKCMHTPRDRRYHLASLTCLHRRCLRTVAASAGSWR